MYGERIRACGLHVAAILLNGLRDYGTGKWVGGADPDCDHLMIRGSQGTNGERAGRRHTQRIPYKGTCGRCGAVREDKQIGLEETPEIWCARLVEVFREIRRVLRKDGSCWVNVGDSYAANRSYRVPDGKYKDVGNSRSSRVPTGIKSKDLIGAPWMLAFALQKDGWYLRADIIWQKTSPMPESVKDRPTKSHEYIFLLSKSARYFYDVEAVKESCSPNSRARAARARLPGHKYTTNGTGFHQQTLQSEVRPNSGKIPAGWHQGGRDADGLTPGGARDRASGVGPKATKREIYGKQNPSMQSAVVDVVGTRNTRSVWRISAQPFKQAHFATWPEKLARPMILAGTSERGVCRQCGTPWTRIVQKRIALLGAKSGNKRRKHRADIGGGVDGHSGANIGVGFPYEALVTETIGWKASCKCFADVYPIPEPVPATVLDPFCGAGTTGVVARKYGRNFVGIDLKAEYLEMARQRIEGTMPLIAGLP